MDRKASHEQQPKAFNTLDKSLAQDVQANSGSNHSYDALLPGVYHGRPKPGFGRRHYNYKSKSPKQHERRPWKSNMRASNRGNETSGLERTFEPSYSNVSASATGPSASTARHSEFITDRYPNNQYRMHAFTPSNPLPALNGPNRFENNVIWQDRSIGNQFSRPQQMNNYRSETNVDRQETSIEQRNWHQSRTMTPRGRAHMISKMEESSRIVMEITSI